MPNPRPPSAAVAALDSFTPRAPDELVFLPLGGTGEIGMNCYCYGVGPNDDRQWLMVDLGVKFGEETDPGIDVSFCPSIVVRNR